MACEDIKTRLDEANDALHRLLTGAQVVVLVDAFRTRIEYRPVDADKLNQYVALLQVQYQACLNAAGEGTCKQNVLTRPIQFVF